jgi:uncharacterized repeat protein (TIGR03803 family)
VVPASVTSIAAYAFQNDYYLTGVYFAGNAPTIGSFGFLGDTEANAYYLVGTTGWSNVVNIPTSELGGIAITASPANGPEPLTVNFTAAGVDSGGHTVTNWNWNFGDGSIDTTQNPSHTYTTGGQFAVALFETSNGVPVAGGALAITASAGTLTAVFTANPTNGLEPLTVSFTGASADSSGRAITNWNWDFGDGTTSTTRSPSHTYSSAGDFSPALTGTNNLGLRVTVAGPSIRVLPLTVAFSAAPDSGLAPLTVNFISAGVDNGGHTVTSWSWSFGDSSTSTVQNPVHTYNAAGNFFTSLTATNNLGLSVVGVGPASVSALLPVPRYTNFTVLHTFTGNDGAYPSAGPILSGNTLYGTTEYSLAPINGTVFSFNDATASFLDLLHFPNLNPPNNSENYDGANPAARLVLSGSTLYGTTSAGGQAGYGNLFSLAAATSRLISLHAFSAPTHDGATGLNHNSDGINPVAALVVTGNSLYGTAQYGGTNGYGVVFGFNLATSNFTTLHAFTGGNDGAFPLGDVILAGNTLYGTANAAGSHGYGTVFSLDTSGSNFVILHGFTGGGDGAYPQQGALLLSSNTLYGTTPYGGSGVGTNGYGTVFRVGANGTNFTTLYSFAGGSDGASPCPSLTLSGQTLYGTAFGGGAASNGTIYSLNLNTQGSNFTLLYSFGPAYTAARTNSDGVNPTPGLVLSENLLYGTATSGGANGYGTLFALPLPGSAPVSVPLNIQINGGHAVLAWNNGASGFSLQSAPAVTGVFTNIPNATPPYSNIITGAKQFFRLIANPP